MTGYFIFDDIDTRTYSGIYVAFDDIDKTPKRVYEEVEIPARNGKLYIDKNRYEDVEHTYHIIATTKANGSALINALASKVGYCKLQDSFNTDEYYEAVFTSGAEVDITPERDTNKFKITFTRKPQRFLTSGDTETSVANNGTISNPTLFESRPKVIANGYGTININGKPITITSQPLGTIILSSAEELTIVTSRSVSFDGSLLSTGDTITSSAFVRFDWIAPQGKYFNGLDPDVDGHNNDKTTYKFNFTDFDLYETTQYINHKKGFVNYSWQPLTFVKGTTSSGSETMKYRLTISGLTNKYTGTVTASYSYNGNGTITYSYTLSNSNQQNTTISSQGIGLNETIGDSTRSSIVTPIIIDFEIGEAYTTINNEMVSVNDSVSFGSDLITLKPSSNTVTYNNTITSLKIVPRWWKI